MPQGEELVVWTDYLLALPITLLTLFALGILLIDFMLPRGDEVGERRDCVHRRVLLGGRRLQNSALWLGAPPVERRACSAPCWWIGSRFTSSILFLAGTAIAILMSVRYLETENENHGEYYALMLLSVAGHDVHGGRLRHRADLHRPGIDGHLHLRAGGISAARPPLE